MERKFRITVDGHAYNVTVEEIGEESTHVSIPGPGAMQVTAPTLSQPAAAPPPAAGGAGDELSPLAGVVQTVEVQVGQQVASGDRLLTLEAMKMTTVVNAHRAGTVSAVAVKPGDAVEAGQVLVSIG